MGSEWKGLLEINGIITQVTAEKTSGSWQGTGVSDISNTSKIYGMFTNREECDTQIGTFILTSFRIDPGELNVKFSFQGKGEPKF